MFITIWVYDENGQRIEFQKLASEALSLRQSELLSSDARYNVDRSAFESLCGG